MKPQLAVGVILVFMAISLFVAKKIGKWQEPQWVSEFRPEISLAVIGIVSIVVATTPRLETGITSTVSSAVRAVS